MNTNEREKIIQGLSKKCFDCFINEYEEKTVILWTDFIDEIYRR